MWVVSNRSKDRQVICDQNLWISANPLLFSVFLDWSSLDMDITSGHIGLSMLSRAVFL